jgi:hypothetical protein
MTEIHWRRWVVVGIVVTLLCAALGTGVVSGQSTPSNYYGTAETEDGTELPSGTTIIAVADGEVQDSIEVGPDGQYGGSGPTDEKLRVDSGVSGPVRFYVEKDDGTRIEANEVDGAPDAGTERLNLTFPDGTISGSPNFGVSGLTPTEMTVTAGETVNVSATVTNRAGSGTQTVALRIDNSEVRSQEVTLDTNEETTIEFTDIATNDLAAGEHTYGVYTDDDNQTGTLTVESRQANFTVSGLSPTDTTVVEGDSINASATIENEGNGEGTQTVRLDAGDTTLASTDVTLASGATQTVEFEGVSTAPLAPGTYTYGVYTANDSQTGTLTVDSKQADFVVSGFSPTEQTILEGDPINASATVTNEGNAEKTQTVTLEAGGTTLASSDVTLAAGDEQTVTFSDVSTDPLAPETYTYGIYTDNGSQTGTLTVEAMQADFTVSGLDPVDETLTVGAEFAASATVTNDGNAEGTQTVTFQIDGTQFGSESVTLAPDEEQTLSFGPVDTSELGPDSYVHEVASANDSQVGTLVVESEPPAAFTVADLRPPDTTVDAGQSFDVEAVIRNDGGQSGTQQIQFRLDSNTVDGQQITLDSGEQATVTFTGIGTDSLEPGTYTYRVRSDDDSSVGTLTVDSTDSTDDEETESFTISSVEPVGATVTEGASINISGTVTNSGRASGTQRVRLFVDGETVQSESVTLAPGAERTVTHTVDSRALDTGSHVYRVVTNDDQQTESFRITTESQATPTPRPSSVTATPPETQPTATETPPPQPPTASSTPPPTPPGTLTETTTEPSTETSQSTTTEDDDGGGGLLPSGLFGTVLLWVGLPLLVIYGILKALAIYLGY